MAAVALLLLTACGAPSSQNAERDPTNASETASPAASAPSDLPPPLPTSAATTPPPASVATSRDEALIRDFVEFAADPSATSAVVLPFADIVDLGLGRDIRTTLSSGDLRDAASWFLRARLFRAHTGPFSALAVLNAHTREAGSDTVGADGAFMVSVGEHPHCASPPEPAPVGLQSLRRVSVQPADGSIDSCLSWFSVDLFLDSNRTITTVTLDLWEP